MHAKIDNHFIELYHNEYTKNIIIYYNYNNNTSCTTLIYLNDKKQFLYNAYNSSAWIVEKPFCAKKILKLLMSSVVKESAFLEISSL